MGNNTGQLAMFPTPVAGTRVPSPREREGSMSDPMLQARPPTPGSVPPGMPGAPAGRGDRSRSRPPTWMVVTVVLLVLAVWWLAARVVDLQSRLTSLEGSQSGSMVASEIVPGATTPLPVDIPPADGDVAKRLIRDALVNVFASDLPAEQRAGWVRNPGDLAARLAALAGGPCAGGVEVVLTELRFVDDDTAWVRYSFVGPGVPGGGSGVVFDGVASRAPERWQLDRDSVIRVLDAAAPFCD